MADVAITTERLLLRRIRLGDAEALFARVVSDGQVARYVGWPRHTSVETTRGVLRYFDAAFEADGMGPVVIVDRASGALLGTGGLSPKGDGTADTGYVLARDAWGRGLATETLMAVIAWARDEGLTRLTACAHPDNYASLRVLEKCGFSPRGTYRCAEFPNLDVRGQVPVREYALNL